MMNYPYKKVYWDGKEKNSTNLMKWQGT